MRLWDGGHQTNLVVASPVGITAAEPWCLVSNLDPGLALVLTYGQHVCCEQQFRDQKSGILPLERSGLRCPKRFDRLLLVVAIAGLVSALQGYAVSLAGERRRVGSPLERGLSFARNGLHWLQQSVIAAGYALMAWMPIPLPALEPCISSRGVRREQERPWFSRIELASPSHPSVPMPIA